MFVLSRHRCCGWSRAGDRSPWFLVSTLISLLPLQTCLAWLALRHDSSEFDAWLSDVDDSRARCADATVLEVGLHCRNMNDRDKLDSEMLLSILYDLILILNGQSGYTQRALWSDKTPSRHISA